MRFAWFLIAATVVRLAVAAFMPLSADEAYYWVWSKALAPGYLDHPPMVALWIRAGTAVLGDTPLGVRLLGPLAAALGSLLLWSAGRDLAPDMAAGSRAAWMLNGTLALNAGSVLMTPDTPLLLFWTACMAALARLARTGNGTWWLAAGIAAGLALQSKYTAGLLAPCALLWVLLAPGLRRWLWHWQPYAGGLLAAAMFAPVLAWNAAHGWVSFAKQGGREADWHPGLAASHLGELVGGQLGLATPLLLAVFCWGIWRLARAGGWWRAETALPLVFTMVPAAVFVQHAFGGRVQANWPGVIYPGAALAAAIAGVGLWQAATWLGAGLSALVFVQATAWPLALPRRLDFSLIRLAGWGGLARQAEAAAGAPPAFIAADDYGVAAELAFHGAAPVLGVEPRWALFNLPAAPLPASPLPTQTGLLVRSQRRAGGPDSRVWPGAVLVGKAVRARGGVVAETYGLYRVAAPVGVAAVMLPAVVLHGGIQPGAQGN
jgi:4-amino-4-deoxy-L-arabinose transferase-like glycosyltransferase